MSRVAFALLVTVLSLAQPAQALVMCAKAGDNGLPRSGAPIRLRDACRALEVVVDPGALGLQGPPGPPDRGALARDANDAIIGSAGTLLQPDQSAGLLPGVQVVVGTPVLSGRPTPIVAPLVTKGFVVGWYPPAGIYFASTDCSGPPYWLDYSGSNPPVSSDGPVRHAKIVGPVVDGSYFDGTSLTVAGENVVAYAPDGSPSLVDARSTVENVPAAECTELGGHLLPNGPCCLETEDVLLAAPAVAVHLGPFVPPFRVDAR